MIRTESKGFTLIELLVVIAIIGILSSVVLASLNQARQRARDAQRISDARQVQLALELYFDDNGAYPDNTQGIAALVTAGYIAEEPAEPVSGRTAYAYDRISATDYCYGVDLENDTHPSMQDLCTGYGGTVITVDHDHRVAP